MVNSKGKKIKINSKEKREREGGDLEMKKDELCQPVAMDGTYLIQSPQKTA